MATAGWPFHTQPLEHAMKIKDLDEYQTLSRRTWNLVRTDHPIVYPTLGLVNEAGELAGKVKKIFRDKEGVISDEDKTALKYELGDVLWYMAQIATELGLSMNEVAEANIEKLFDRLERGKIKGEGDYR
jgi:NTP pyrophosphatase (non-canonical NTP hydrolase)